MSEKSVEIRLHVMLSNAMVNIKPREINSLLTAVCSTGYGVYDLYIPSVAQDSQYSRMYRGKCSYFSDCTNTRARALEHKHTIMITLL